MPSIGHFLFSKLLPDSKTAIFNFGFNKLGLHSSIARYFDKNPARGRVMEKCGMTYVGTIREHEFRFDKYYNVGYYEMLETYKREK